MKKLLTFLSTCLVVGSLFTIAHAQDTPAPEKTEPAKLEIYKHSTWSEIVPKGVDGDGIRMNLAPEGSLEFKDMTLTVVERIAATSEEDQDKVTITLKKGEESETKTVEEFTAFNWNGYHISIVAIYATKGDLGFDSTVFEVATVDSLPEEIAKSEKAMDADHRLKVKHTIDKLTLHHSATPLTLEDDLGKKMRNMQIWGKNDRQWFDVPYHFIIDIDGSILEARDYHYMGDTNTRYDPRGHFLINCYGNYSKQEPNKKQIEAIATLMAWAAAEYKIDPLEIYGHRDLASTSCPGDNLYQYIEDGTLKKKIREILQNGKPELIWLEEKAE